MMAAGCASSAPEFAGPPQPPIDEIPYRIDYQGWITVDAYIGGDGPFDFIVDSGATITSVFANVTQHADITPANRAPIQIVGLTGSQSLPAYEIGDISVSSLHLPDHVGVVLPDWAPPNTPPQGVLGLDLLTRYRTLFSNEEKRIKVYAPDAAPDHPMNDWIKTPLTPFFVDGESDPLYRINVSVRGVQIPCIIDLGASGTIFNMSAYRRVNGGLFVNGTRRQDFRTGTHIQDVFDTIDKAFAVRIARLRISNAAWANHIVIVYDAKIFDDFGVDHQPFCLIGADLFIDRSFMMDFAGEALYVEPGVTRSRYPF